MVRCLEDDRRFAIAGKHDDLACVYHRVIATAEEGGVPGEGSSM